MAGTQYSLVANKESENSEKKTEVTPSSYGYGVRHIQALLIFIALAITYATRGHMAVSIVSMTMENNVNKTRVMENKLIENDTIISVSHTDLRDNLSVVIDNCTSDNKWEVYRTYDWPKSTQEMILGSFFLGYSIMMFPSGIICQKFGGKIPLQVSLLVNSFVSFFTPWIVAWGGWKALCSCRMLQGLSQAGLYPSLSTLMSNWLPVSERGSVGSSIFTGSGIGTIAGFQIAGILSFSHFGWPSTFWVFGVLNLIGFLVMTFFGAATPDTHRSISDAEKEFIRGNVSQRVVTKCRSPWKSICTSGRVWATFTAHVGSAVGYVFLFTQVPTYMFGVLKVNVRDSGLLSSLPYISGSISSVAFGYVSDYCTNRNIVTLKTARIASNSVSTIFPAICCALVSYTTSTAAAVALFVLSQTTHAAINTGWLVNYIDLSPNYSGLLMATGNTIANIFIVMLPVLVSYVVTDVNNAIQWRVMMMLIAGVLVVTNTIFLFFMSADVQPWNDEHEKEADDITLEVQMKKLKD